MADVSVITPMYNGSRWIERCIRSVAAQTEPVREHIVIDNNSTDDGVARVAGLIAEFPHLRLLSCPTKGAGPTRNVGSLAANGRFIAFLDCDDEWDPRKIEQQISAMLAHNLAFSWHDFSVYGPDGHLIRRQSVLPRANRRDLMRKRLLLASHTVVYDRIALGQTFLMNSLPAQEDFCLFLDAMKAAEIRGLPVGGLSEDLASTHIQKASVSSDKLHAAKIQWRAYREHLGLSRLQSAPLIAEYAVRAVADRVVGRFRAVA